MDLIDLGFILSWLVPLLIFVIYGAFITLANLYGKGHDHESFSLDENPSVSIIIPTHNEQQIIKGKIESVLKSNYNGELIEIICVDDSTDQTPMILRKMSDSDSRIKNIFLEKRQGYSNAVLKGVRSSTTEVVIITDSHSLFGEE